MQATAVAALCYDEGWRDKNLITMVAIVGAESNYDESFESSQYNRYGLFALWPTLVDHQTDILYDPHESAHVARQVFEEKFFMPWLSFALGKHYKFVKGAIDAVGSFFHEMYKDEYNNYYRLNVRALS